MARTKTVTVEVTRELTFSVDVEVEWEEDDDGVGDPPASGNSMTGRRGGRWVPSDIDIDVDSLYKAAKSALGTDDDDIQDAVRD